MKILFLLKKHNNYGKHSYDIVRSGLLNSATITAKELSEHYHIETLVKVISDSNSIDKEVFNYKPNVCILEAIWFTDAKLLKLTQLHPKVKFVVRIHSEIPFLANEGDAIEKIRSYLPICRVFVSFNSHETYNDFRLCFPEYSDKILFLPNIYESELGEYIEKEHHHDTVNIACFGAIRPMKNQLIQAMAAITYAKSHRKKLHFHVNASRLEQGGESVYKNITALFKDEPGCELIQHKWLHRKEFLELISRMDAGMQVSLTESFNIVAADFVLVGVPIVVSIDIEWMPEWSKVYPCNMEQILAKIEDMIRYPHSFVNSAKHHLKSYNHHSIKEWKILI